MSHINYITNVTPVSYFLSSITGRVLSPTRTQVSRQASCCIGLPLLRELALLTFYMLWLCNITEGSGTRSMQLFTLCKSLKVIVVKSLKMTGHTFPLSCAMAKLSTLQALDHTVTIAHMTNMVAHMTNMVAHMTNMVAHMTNMVAHMTNMVAHMTNMVAHMTTMVAHMTTMVAHMTSTVAHTTSTVAHMTSTVAHTTSTVAHMTNMVAHMTDSLNLTISARF